MTLRSDTTAVPSLLTWPVVIWLAGSIPAALALFSGATATSAETFLLVGGICFLATVASLLPIRNLAQAPSDTLAVGLLVTTAIRGGTSLCLLIAGLAMGWIDRGSVALPIVLWYMAFLVTDLVVVHRFLAQALPTPVRPESERTTC